MLKNEIKIWLWNILYIIGTIGYMWAINYKYIEIIIEKIIEKKNIFAINMYEILITNIKLSLFITGLYMIPILYIFIIIYIISGLYKYEVKKNVKEMKKWIIKMVIDYIIIIQIIIKNIIIMESNTNKMIQIYTYENITNILIKIIIIWIIWSNLNIKKRITLGVIIIILSIFVIPPDVIKQIEMILIILIYNEIKVIIQFLQNRWG